MFNYHPPSNLRDMGVTRNPRESCRAGGWVGGWGGTHSRFHSSPSWVMVYVRLIASAKTGARGRVYSGREVFKGSGINVHLCGGSGPNMSANTAQKYCGEPWNNCQNKNILICRVWRKQTRDVVKLPYFNFFPMFQGDSRLGPGGGFGKPYLLWNNVSSSRHTAEPLGGNRASNNDAPGGISCLFPTHTLDTLPKRWRKNWMVQTIRFITAI